MSTPKNISFLSFLRYNCSPLFSTTRKDAPRSPAGTLPHLPLILLISRAGRRIKNFLSRPEILLKNPRHALITLATLCILLWNKSSLIFFFLLPFSVLSRGDPSSLITLPFCLLLDLLHLDLIRVNWIVIRLSDENFTNGF